jgi:hypothetical protein
MFVRYFVEVRLAAPRVEAALLAAPDGWLPAVAADASRHGERLLARARGGAAGGAADGADGGEPVEVELGRAVRFPSKLALPISWWQANGGGMLPALDAEIEVGTLGPDHTQLALNGRYARPTGTDGRVVDRFLLHRVAEATVKRFLDEVADRVARDAPAAGPVPAIDVGDVAEVAGQAPPGARPDW